MKNTQMLVKLLFAALSIALAMKMTTDALGMTFQSIATGALTGALLFGFVFAIGALLKKTTPRELNTITVGLLFGALLGYALAFVAKEAFALTGTETIADGVAAFIYLISLYLGVIITAKAEEDIQLSIPFLKLEPTAQKKRDLLLDLSILQDARVIDLAQSGLLDERVVLPRSVIKELQELLQNGDETTKTRARRTLDVIAKLEALPSLKLRFTDADFSEKDATTKMIRLAIMIDADLLTADISRIEQASVEGVRIINIHSLSNALKPLTHSGETLTIKVQRYGKEPRQGVGYLEDGTMVVINGGADFIGETIKTHVLSVKHTSSGRMIFCNALEDEEEDEIPYRSDDRSFTQTPRPKTPYTV